MFLSSRRSREDLNAARVELIKIKSVIFTGFAAQWQSWHWRNVIKLLCKLKFTFFKNTITQPILALLELIRKGLL